MKPTILITAYAVNPFKGSEDGTGWNISRELSKYNKCIVVTRKNNAGEIKRYLAENNAENLADLSFLYYDLPLWAMRLKKKLGERGYVLYFYFWQLFLPFFVLKRKVKFDLSYALNFHSDSTPQFLWVLGKPVIWGPVGHHPMVPNKYLSGYSWNDKLKDKGYNLVKWVMRNLDPFFYLAKWKSNSIIGINSSVQKVMGIPASKFKVIPAVGGIDPRTLQTKRSSEFIVLSVGRLTAMKGFDISLRAFSCFYSQLPKVSQPEVKLQIVGSGECESDLKKLAADLNIIKSVEFISWVPKAEMNDIYCQASAFLFPSHEGAGMVVPEAMSYALPVLCFDNYGPGELVGNQGFKVKYSNYQNSVKQFSQELLALFNDEVYREKQGMKMRERFLNEFTWSKKGRQIQEIIKTVIPSKVKTVAVFHPSAELYGADRIMVNALKALPEKVRKVVYLYREGPLENFITEMVPNVQIEIVPQMPIIYRSIFSFKGIVGFIIQWFNFLFYLKNENTTHQFTSAYVNTLSSCFLLPILYFLGIKRYIHIHEIIDRPKLVGYATAWIAWLFANKIVVVSQAVYQGLSRYVSLSSKKVDVIHNGITPIEIKKRSPNDKVTFYLFGRIKPEKGQWFLLNTLRLVPRSLLENSKFILMGGVAPGQESMLKELEQIIHDEKLDEVVQIQGFSPCISSAMSNADVCLVPSLMKDPFPTTVLEAMSAAKPVISTNHGGAKEAIVDNETGYLISPNNTQEFAQVISKLIRNTKLVNQLGINGKLRFQKLFTLEKFETNWTEFVTKNQWV